MKDSSITQKLFLGFIGSDQLCCNETLCESVQIWKDANLDRNIKTYYGDEFDIYHFEQDYLSPSLFNPNTLIIIKEVHKILLSSQKKMLDLFKNLNPTVSIFVISSSWKATNHLYKWFKKNGSIQNFKEPWSNQIPQWIVQRSSSKYQRPISITTAHYLWECVGENLKEIDQELQNFDSFIPKKQEISLEDLQNLLSRHRNYTFFELNQAIGLRNKTYFIICLKSLLEQKEPPFVLAIRIFNHCIKLLKIFSLYQQNKSPQNIAKTVNINPFIFEKEKYIQQALTRSQKQWEKVLIRLSELEWLFKRDNYTEKFEIEMVFFSLL